MFNTTLISNNYLLKGFLFSRFFVKFIKCISGTANPALPAVQGDTIARRCNLSQAPSCLHHANKLVTVQAGHGDVLAILQEFLRRDDPIRTLQLPLANKVLICS